MTNATQLSESLKYYWHVDRCAQEVGVSTSTFNRLRNKGEGPPVALWLTPRIPLWDPAAVRAWAVARGGTVLKRFRIPNAPTPQVDG